VVRLAILIGGLLLAAVPSGASNAVSLGYSEETTIVEPGTDDCASGNLIYNHDGSFENGYAWHYGGCVPPYFGALAEAYDLGAGMASCASYWLTSMPGWESNPGNCYLWEGGVDSAPGAVLGVVTDAAFGNLPQWPQVGENDVAMNIEVAGSFTVGIWQDCPGALANWFCAADLDGPPGHPWTCIAPGIGYPSGWQDPSIVWGPTSSMGCGVYFEQGTPVERETWGAVKSLFK
jgi:hypothetical protein